MTEKITCQLSALSAAYDIIVQRALLKDHKKLVSLLKPFGSQFVIITDDKLAELYGNKLHQILIENGIKTLLFTFPQGEQSKSRETKETLENQMFENQLGRDTCLIALGGGVVTDLGGFLAATYCRGIPLVMIPTSLLGMVDASIGGKTGVNVPHGKNMIGCIYQPKLVILDPAVCDSLPSKEIRSGAVEMIKHGLIADASYFDFLEKEAEKILELQSDFIEKAIIESCIIKKNIVEQDERENGKRYLLNFGHTIGHALEILTNFEITHGEAVAIGILVESFMAVQLKQLKEETFQRIWKVFIKYRLPLTLPLKLSVDTIMQTMVLDKKTLKGLPRFVILKDIGSPIICESAYCSHIEEIFIKNALNWMNHDLCRL